MTHEGLPRVCGYCLAKYHIRLIKYSSMPCDVEWADKYESARSLS